MKIRYIIPDSPWWFRGYLKPFARLFGIAKKYEAAAWSYEALALAVERQQLHPNFEIIPLENGLEFHSKTGEENLGSWISNQSEIDLEKIFFLRKVKPISNLIMSLFILFLGGILIFLDSIVNSFSLGFLLLFLCYIIPRVPPTVLWFLFSIFLLGLTVPIFILGSSIAGWTLGFGVFSLIVGWVDCDEPSLKEILEP